MKSNNRFVLNIIKINLTIFILISIFPIGKFGLKYLENDFLKQVPISNIKNIVVLAGSEDLVSTLLTEKLNLNENSKRLISSIYLANEFENSKIFYVGGNGHIIKNNLSELTVAKEFYRNINFNLERVMFIGNTRNTIENLREIKKLNFSNENTILITSAFHMKRSLMIAKKLKLKLFPYAVDFRSVSNQSFINSYQRFSISSNLGSFDLFIREIIGIIAFKILM